PNTLSITASGPVFRNANRYDVVWISPVSSPPGAGGEFYWAEDYPDPNTGKTTWRFHSSSGGAPRELAAMTLSDEIRVFKATVQIAYPDTTPRADVFESLALDPRHTRSLNNVFAQEPSNRQQSLTLPVAFQFSGTGDTAGIGIANLLVSLTGVDVPSIIAN